MTSKDLAANLTIQNFAAAPTKVTTSLTSPIATVQFRAYGPVYGDYDLALECSRDGGLSFDEGTPEFPSELLGLTLSPFGEDGVFTWEIEEDLGEDRFNRDIIVRLQLRGVNHTSVWSYLSFSTVRNTTDKSASYGKSSLSKDFVGASPVAKGLKKDIQ